MQYYTKAQNVKGFCCLCLGTSACKEPKSISTNYFGPISRLYVVCQWVLDHPWVWQTAVAHVSLLPHVLLTHTIERSKMFQPDDRNDLSSTTMMTPTLFSGPVIQHSLKPALPCFNPCRRQNPLQRSRSSVVCYWHASYHEKKKGETVNLPGHQGFRLALSAPHSRTPSQHIGPVL